MDLRSLPGDPGSSAILGDNRLGIGNNCVGMSVGKCRDWHGGKFGIGGQNLEQTFPQYGHASGGLRRAESLAFPEIFIFIGQLDIESELGINFLLRGADEFEKFWRFHLE